MVSSASCPQPAVASPVLSLPPCGIEDAVDVEMGGAGGSVIAGQAAGDSLRSSSSVPSSTTSSVSSSALSSADPAVPVALGQQAAGHAESACRRQKAKAKKQRQKDKKKAEARQRTNEAKSERQDVSDKANTQQRATLTREEFHTELAKARAMLEEEWALEDGEMDDGRPREWFDGYGD